MESMFFWHFAKFGFAFLQGCTETVSKKLVFFKLNHYNGH